MTDLKRTPFYALEAEHQARFVPFAGYELPVTFEAGLMEEHHAVRRRVGVFDVSHMGEVVIDGKDALPAVQWLVTNNVDVAAGKAVYTVMCVADGGIVDDLIVYREGEQSFFLCVNGACRHGDVAHIKEQAKRFDCRVRDLSDDWAQLAIQGPKADLLLSDLSSHETATMPSFTFADAEVGGVKGVRIARTGYTGEPGVELYVKNGDAARLWRAMADAGKKHGLGYCGLGCRDTLRLEMKYPLYGNDIDRDHNPIEAGLAWVVKLKKGEFLGRAALQAAKTEGVTRQWVGFEMVGRGIPRQHYEIHKNGAKVGEVTSGTHSPSLGRPIGCGYVPTALATVGSELDVVVRGKPVLARVVTTPFYKREQP
ncbi:MAG: glycine cleavage system aminomethyltransferase GcvT [Deltaproteobacteria bacterium]|nr:glycine cleavage system aminomethyltransferase GcvT [Deltaproteobacteria bacterium]